MKKIISVILVLSFYKGILFSQSTPKTYMPPSPTASQLAAFINIPVNYYTGEPQIEIPIYANSIKNCNLDLKLSYNCNGIKAGEDASYVGLGWSLTGLGIITRTTRGIDDLKDNKAYWKDGKNNGCNAQYDQEPDIFYFNFCGYSGKFLIVDQLPNGNPKFEFLKKQPFKIELNISMVVWKITVDDGTVFEFEKKELSQSSDGVVVSSWYLTKVVNSYNQEITINYKTNASFERKIKTSITTSDDGYYPSWLFSSYVSWGGQTGISHSSNYGHSYTVIEENFVNNDEVLPDKIILPDRIIDFIYEDRIDMQTPSSSARLGKKLTDMRICTKQNNEIILIKKVNLVYDYYDSNSGNSPKISKRLRLREVFDDIETSTNKKYVIFYNTGNLPDKQNVSSITGSFSDPTLGLITEIQNPTGGSLKFVFEPSYTVYPNYFGLARIKSTKKIENNQTTEDKSFEYFGFKQLTTNLTPIVYSTSEPFSVTVGAGSPSEFTTQAYIFKKTSYYSDMMILGEIPGDYMVGYSKVVEKNGVIGKYGKTEYEFYNDVNNTNSLGPSNLYPLNGQLISLKTYSTPDNGNTFQLLQEQNSLFSFIQGAELNIDRMSFGTCGLNYKLKYGWVRLDNQTTKTYDLGNPTINNTQSINYTYSTASHLKPIEIENINSKGKVVKKMQQFVSDFATNTNNVYDKMVAKNMINSLVQERVYFNGVERTAKKNNYSELVFTPNPIYVINTQEESFNGQPLHTSFSFNKHDKIGNVLEMRKKQDITTSYIWEYNKTNPIAEAKNATSKDFGFTSFEDDAGEYWKENFNASYLSNDAHTGEKSYRVPQGTNVYGPLHVFEPAIQNGKFIFTCWVKTDISYTGGASLVLLSDYLFCSTNFVTQPIPNTNGQWLLASVELNLDLLKAGCGINASQVSNIRATIINTNSNQGILIDDLVFKHVSSTVQTNTYKAGIGVTSETSINNKTTFYEYDNWGRLKLIRDNEKNILKKICYSYYNTIGGCIETEQAEKIFLRLEKQSELTRFGYPWKADFYIRFYKDKLCTIPYQLQGDMKIYFQKNILTNSNPGVVTNDNTPYLASAGATEVFIGNQIINEVYFCHWCQMPQYIVDIHRDFKILPGRIYVVVE